MDHYIARWHQIFFADFEPLNRAFSEEKNRGGGVGGGSKAVWNFSEN